MAKRRKIHRLLIGTLLMLTATASVCLWLARSARAATSSATVSVSSSAALTLKFSGVPPSTTIVLLGQPGVASGLPATNDTRLITVSNTGSSGNIDLNGIDDTSTAHIIAVVGPSQKVALSVPTVWFATDLSVTNFGTAAGQGVVTVN